MSRKTKISQDAEAAAAKQAAADAELLAKLQNNPPPPPPEPTIADRFVQMNELLLHERQRTRLGEAALTKMFELAVNYHIWNLQWEAQQQRASFFTPEGGVVDDGEPQVLPDADEYLGEAEPPADGAGAPASTE